MQNKTENQSSTSENATKSKFFLRIEAIVPFLILCTLIYLYFFLLFDRHLKSALEFIGYQINGAEVNIGQLETQFTKASILIKDIEITDTERPQKNAILIKKIEFKALWDALLRARFVADHFAVEGIQVNTPRKKQGKVKPPTKPSDSEKKGTSFNPLLEKEGQKIFSLGLQELEQKNQNNALVSSLGLIGASSQSNSDFKIESQLKSKAQLEKVQTLFTEKQKYWNEQLSSLSNQKDLEALKNKFNQIKTKDFKDVSELQLSLQALDTLSKEATAKYTSLQLASQSLQKDLESLNQESLRVNDLIREDTKNLEALFKIPSIDSASLSKSIFLKYLVSKLYKYQKYYDLAEKYLPQSVMSDLKSQALSSLQGRPAVDKKKSSSQLQVEENMLVAHPRLRGVNYEFSSPNSYPLFWVKEISISSKSSGNDGLGNLNGYIRNIVSNQSLIQKPTTIHLSGDFPSEHIQGIFFEAQYNNLKKNHHISFDSKVGSYPLENVQLLSTPEAEISFLKTTASFSLSGTISELKNISFVNNNYFLDVVYELKSNKSDYHSVLKSLFESIKKVTLETRIEGILPQVNLSMNSNLGSEIQKNIEGLIQVQINKARATIDEYIQKEVGKNKKQLEAEINTLKTNIESKINQSKKDFEAQKKLAESKIESTKKETENKAKKELENKVKDSVEDLKKKFGI